MRKTTKVTGTKIAQAAKDLNVTSVTIRRYISEFNIETATDENGIKVLPPKAMDELQVIRKLKEDGLTNPKVLEELEATRSKGGGKSKAAAAAAEEEEEKEPAKPARKATRIESKPTTKKASRSRAVVEEVQEEEEEEVEEAPAAKRGARRRTKAEPVEKEEVEVEEEEEASDEESSENGESDAGADGRPKHSLTCQTCGKTFEHMNPRLRDCLDCYRAKRKERRRGGDRHKNVIQHPLAQQVASKMASQKDGAPAEPAAERPERAERAERAERPERGERQNYAPTRTAAPRQERTQLQSHSASSAAQPVIGGLKTKVRSYRKAIEETRNITGSLKRRLERPDLPEGDRRWLEQIYAYQLILHQGWRHLSEYKSATPKQDDK